MERGWVLDAVVRTIEGGNMKDVPRKGLGLRAVAAFAIGATLGSIVALLYAPASGKVTRRRIALRLRRVRQVAGRRFIETRLALARRAGQMQKAARGWITNHMPTNGHQRPLRRRVRHAHAHAN